MNFRVLLIITAREVGGAEIYVDRLVRTLRDTCKFTIVLPDHKNLHDFRASLAESSQVISLPFEQPYALLRTILALRQLARLHDLVHINSNHPASRLGIMATFAFVGSTTPVVSVEHRATALHDIRVPASIAWLLPILFRWSRIHVKRLVAVSNENARTLISYYGIPRSKIAVIHNSVDIEAFAHPTQHFEDTRRHLGLQAQQPMILVLAKLMPSKGHRYLIEAAPQILAQFPTAHFVFAGTMEEKAPLEQQISKLGLQAHFSLLGFRSDTIDLLHAADLFVLPSLAEGFALTIIEALAAGVPIVATDVGGASEAIENGKNGFLVPAANPDALATSIIHILNMGIEERTALKIAARHSAEQFSLRAMADKTFQVYQQAIDSI